MANRSIFGALLLLFLSTSSKGMEREEWLYQRTVDDPPKHLTVRETQQKNGTIQRSVSLRHFCFSLGCSNTFQWNLSRVVISNEKNKSNAILSRHLRHVLINGVLFKISNPIHYEAKEGYSIPIDLAQTLAIELGLGTVKKEEKTRDVQINKSLDKETELANLETIVIDPGHGGSDYGTSSNGLLEKDVSLIYARKLKEVIGHDLPGVSVYLTRNSDEYVSLAERSKFANSKSAQLFLSLHLNHAGNENAEGIEVYFLSPEATDIEAKKVALLENETWLQSIHLPRNSTNDDENIKKILIDMEQTKFIRDSSEVAAKMESHLRGLEKRFGMKNRGVKQAMFYVLSQVAMPSVLLEMGFLSNAGDRSRLMNISFRDKFLETLASALKQYKMEKKYGEGK